MIEEYCGPERRARAHTDTDRVREVVQETLQQVLSDYSPLTEDERRWVRLAIQREAQSIALRRAVIEKTLAGLVWAAIVALGVVFFEYLRSHGLDLSSRKTP